MSWAACFGHRVTEGDTMWVEMPQTLRGDALRYVINCSSAAMERCMASFRKDGTVIVENGKMRVSLKALDRAHQWLRNSEEPSALPRPDLFRQLLD